MKTIERMTASLCIAAIRAVLLPIDLILRCIGPHFDLFIGLFRTVPAPVIACIARIRAVRAADNAARNVPAYRAFLRQNGTSADDLLRLSLPFTDKENYVKRNAVEQRCVNGVLPLQNVTIDESSGSTGTPYNWVRSGGERHTSRTFISHFSRYCFGGGPMITINAFSMGAWATGLTMGQALERRSAVKNTGPDPDKIFNTLAFFGTAHRYCICGYPPFLKHLIDEARVRRFPLGQYSLAALLGGEGNSEGLRDYLLGSFETVYSGYGATDVEIGIAGETLLSTAIRREARHNERLRAALFGDGSRLPMLFQYNPLMHHITADANGELSFTITRLNVLSPRINYNIHDEGGVAPFAVIEERCRAAGFDLRAAAADTGTGSVPLPFLWVYGRKDSTVSVMGANIYPEDIEQCLFDEPALAAVTRSYCLGLHEDGDASVRPHIAFEVSGELSTGLTETFRTRITSRLVALNADFREAMREHAASASPLIEIFAPGTGPFAGDKGRIKQVRTLQHG
ncbi:MAG: phenylacetate--CoA ligase family protein [Spirochaetes bacterium]|nr:phenylacetate--CoA ligase family protein [Spirochaetota bacterium]